MTFCIRFVKNYHKKTGKIYVINAGAQIDVIDPAKQKVITTYTINFATGLLSVVDGGGNKITGSVSIGPGFTPSNCYSNQAQCTDFGNLPTVVRFNPYTNKIYEVNMGDFFQPNASSDVLVIKRISASSPK